MSVDRGPGITNNMHLHGLEALLVPTKLGLPRTQSAHSPPAQNVRGLHTSHWALVSDVLLS
jgi:hypothetical protein